MKLKRFFIAAALLVMSATALMAQELPPIPKDDKVRIGKLDNGLTYYIRNNNWPENKANFYIAQRVGSIQENDDQRGLAHFLEHMAFNGSEHFPDSTLLEYTRSLGVEFGSDLNAYTSIDQTVYRISNVPTKRAAAIDSCILILKDFLLHGVKIAQQEIRLCTVSIEIANLGIWLRQPRDLVVQRHKRRLDRIGPQQLRIARKAIIRRVCPHMRQGSRKREGKSQLDRTT